MLNNIIELADNKLLILYIIKKLKHPCTNIYITDIILSNNFLNYFLLQQYLNDLVESNYLILLKPKDEVLYKLAPRGKKVLEMFQGRISKFKIDCFNNYMNSCNKKEQVISLETNYTKTKPEGFTLNISFNQKNETLLKLSLKAKSKNELDCIIKNCEENTQNIYTLILSSLKSSKK